MTFNSLLDSAYVLGMSACILISSFNSLLDSATTPMPRSRRCATVFNSLLDSALAISETNYEVIE